MLTSLRQRLAPHAIHLMWSGIRFGMHLARDPAGGILWGNRLIADPYDVYEDLRRRGPMVASRLPGLVIATGHAAVDASLRELKVGAAPGHEMPQALLWDSPLSPSLLDTDPPDHTRIRRLVAQAFTPRAIERLRQEAEEVTADLLDEAASRGQVDLVEALAAPLPIRMICRMLGIPADQQARFTRWGEALGLSLEPTRSPADQARIEQAGAELREFFADIFAARRADPDGVGEDVLGRLLAAREGEDRLSDAELTATCILLLGAGFETTVNLIGSGVLALMRHPDQLRMLVDDPSLVPNAVEELLRYDSPVQLTGRIAWTDTEIAGTVVPAGSAVMALLGAANRDPEVFDEPHQLRVDRPNARAHLAFSSGVHFCLGAPLARLEGEVALRQLLARFPDLRQSAPARRRQTRVLRGLTTLPVTLKP